MIIAIDGPAGSGKSTIAKLLADKLNMLYIDTGSMYRSVTWAFLQAKENSSETDEELLQKILPQIHIKLQGKEVFISTENETDKNISTEIRTSNISNNVSHVAAFKIVREKLVEEQRLMGKENSTGAILDGRDIGTVVFPNAELKIFLTASPEVRAQRRLKDLEDLGEKPDLTQLIEEVKLRDKKDSERAESPLRKADDAIEINTDNLSIEEVVRKISEMV